MFYHISTVFPSFQIEFYNFKITVFYFTDRLYCKTNGNRVEFIQKKEKLFNIVLKNYTYTI